MPITPEEQADLDVLHKKTAEIKISAFDMAREYERMSVDELRASGHKTPEGAILYTIRSALKEINKVTETFLKKWPDE